MNWRKPLLLLALNVSGSKIPSNLKRIQSYAVLSEDELRQVQSSFLKKLLLHAYQNVPYYRHLFTKIDLIKNEAVDLQMFECLPLLSKELIRKAGGLLKAKDSWQRKAFSNTSGGSTGEPVVLIQDKQYQDWNIANKLFYAQMVGKDIGQKELKLWGSERDILQGSIGKQQQLQNWLYNRVLLNSFKMDPQTMTKYVQVLNQEKPVHIWSYVDSIFELAKHIKQNDISLQHSPQSIIVTAGVLTQEVRSYVESVFKTKVYNQYGSREVGDMAAEGRLQNGLETFPWTHYLEIVNGQVVVTTLQNYSMPLIRYQIGDTAEWLNHDRWLPGQINSPKLAKISGRVTNHFKLKDGSIIHGEYFTHVFYFKPWIKKFKIIQESYDLVRCLIVLADEEDAIDKQEMIRQMKVVLGNTCQVEFEYVSDIPASKSGKYLYTLSKV